MYTIEDGNQLPKGGPMFNSNIDRFIFLLKLFAAYHTLFFILSLVLARIDEGEFNETFGFVFYYDVIYLIEGFFMDILLCGVTLLLLRKISSLATITILLFETILVFNTVSPLPRMAIILSLQADRYDIGLSIVLHLLVIFCFYLARVLVLKKAKA